MLYRITTYCYALLAIAVLFIIGCALFAKAPMIPNEVVRSQYRSQLELFDSSVLRLSAIVYSQDEKLIQSTFLTTRLRYKAIEPIAEYYSGGAVHAINGPPREQLSDESPNDKPIKPEGFQMIEQYIFPHIQKDHLTECGIYLTSIHQYINNLRSTAATSPFSDAHIFDAVRLELFRIISLGISGFDCAVARNSIAEAAAALESCKRMIACYDNSKSAVLQSRFDSAIAYCNRNNSFDEFNRAECITKYINPVCEALNDLRREIKIAPAQYRQLLRTTAATMFNDSEYDPFAFAPQYNDKPNSAQVTLGRMLFFDPVLSANGKRSCASCHDPKQAFTDGKIKSTAFDFEGSVDRNSPTLLNAALQREYFLDGRALYLEDQVSAVVKSHKEFRQTYENICQTLGASAEYQQLFAEAYPTTPSISAEHTRSAIASYVRSLISMNSPFDKFMRGDNSQINARQIHGFNLFMGKAACGSCHFLPLFNGTAPPKFDESEWEVLGVPSSADTVHIKLDSDIGRYGVNRLHTVERNGFKTPTLRNIAVTAPYMHNGAYPTLQSVLEFYNHGGGVGLGLTLPNQTLSAEKLHLTSEEMADIIAFLQTVTDTTGSRFEAPMRLPKFISREMAERRIGGEY